MSKSRCYQLVHSQWRERLKEIRQANRLEEKTKEFIERILSKDETRLVKFCLRWGGPADYIELEVDKEKNITGGTYIYQDWFDFARRTIYDDELIDVKKLFQPLIENE